MRSRRNNTTNPPRVHFNQVRANVDHLMEVFKAAAEKNPSMNDALHGLYRYATVEYLNRVGWTLEEFTSAHERVASGHEIKESGPVLVTAIS